MGIKEVKNYMEIRKMVDSMTPKNRDIVMAFATRLKAIVDEDRDLAGCALALSMAAHNVFMTTEKKNRKGTGRNKTE